MKLHPSREVYDLLFAKERTVAKDEIGHIRLRHAEIGCCCVSDLLLSWYFLRRCDFYRFCVAINDRFVASIFVQHMLNLMTQHEPKIVDPVKTQRHPDDWARDVSGQPEAHAIDLR
jgi:hypothetical protein